MTSQRSPDPKLPSPHRIADIAYSDSDTVPEYSNKDKPNGADDEKLVIIVKTIDMITKQERERVIDNVISEINHYKRDHFKIFVSPHNSTITLASTLKRHEKIPVHVSYSLAEPKQEKIPILTQTEIRQLKLDIEVGRVSFSSDKTETPDDVAKRLQNVLDDITATHPNVIMFVGPVAYNTFVEVLTNKKLPKLSKSSMCLDVFKRHKKTWELVPKK